MGHVDEPFDRGDFLVVNLGGLLVLSWWSLVVLVVVAVGGARCSVTVSGSGLA